MTILVIQTAFLGDVILTTPLLGALANAGHTVDIVVTPAGSRALEGHRAVRRVIVYDKKGSERGVVAFVRLAGVLRRMRYDTALIPHRSFRSAMLPLLAWIPRRIGFDRSAASWTLTRIVPYRANAHEIDRNLDLLAGVPCPAPMMAAPSLTIASSDREHAKAFLSAASLAPGRFVAVAPGSVWNTKRWPEDRFADLTARLSRRNVPVALIGGTEDTDLCRRIQELSGGESVVNLAGRLSVLQSAAVIGEAGVLVTNDSAPLHLASAMGTPVVALFGATSPSYGFGPRGGRDAVIETSGLACRPCAIHGGERCPIGTFECMLRIEPVRVEAAVLAALASNR